METAEHQEWRARQQLDPLAAIKAGLSVGIILFIMSGGSPWSTAGTMNMIMGRDIPVSFWPLAIGHFGLSIIYSFVIAGVIYRYPAMFAVPAGVLVGMALYALNVLVYQSGGFTMQSPEFVTWFVHFIFALFASLVYKAASVPPPEGAPDRRDIVVD